MVKNGGVFVKIRILTGLLVFIMIAFTAIKNFANYADVPPNAPYREAVNRLTGFGIIKGDNMGMFRPEGNVTREQFVTMLVNGLGFESQALEARNREIFRDIEPDRWSKGFVNIGYEKGFLKGIEEGIFAPLQDVTFGQGATILVRARGEEVIEGVWPNNYIQKAQEMRITTGVSFRGDEKLPRWAVAVMIDNMLSQDIGGTIKMGADLTNAYEDYIILGDATTLTELPKNQIATNKGPLTRDEDAGKIVVGSKVRLATYGDRIIQVIGIVNEVKSVTLRSFIENQITYIEEFMGEEKSMQLPQGIPYYYKGTLVDYGQLANIMKANTSIIFGRRDIFYDYALIIDPIYRTPFIASKDNMTINRVGSIFLGDENQIFKNGKRIARLDIDERDVVYRVRDFNNFIEFFEVFDRKAEGEITAILPDALSPRVVQIDGVNYEIGLNLDMSKINSDKDGFAVEDRVSALLGYNGKIVEIEPLELRSSIQVEVIIQGDSRNHSNLAKGQVITDRGILNVLGEVQMELGRAYKVNLDGNRIVRVIEEATSVEVLTIDSASENLIRVKDRDILGNMEKVFTKEIPNGIPYYYNGAVIPFDQVARVLQNNSALVFAKNQNGPGFQYGVIVDPEFGAPYVVKSANLSTMILPGMNFQDKNLKIIKNGKTILFDEIRERDLVYIVKDINGQYPYVFVLDSKIEGEIIQILPNKASPQSVQIEGGIIELSRYFNVDHLNLSRNAFNVGDEVSLILGVDGKGVGMDRLITRSGPEVEMIISANEKTNSTLGNRQVITNLGIYNMTDFSVPLEVGGKYKVVLDGAYIVRVIDKLGDVDYFAVENAVGNLLRIRTKSTDDRTVTLEFSMPNGIPYYYNGALILYESIRGILKTNSTIALAKNNRGSGYEYGVIMDPVMSKPEVNTLSSVVRGSVLGDLVFDNYTRIIRNGDIVAPSALVFEDVVYAITDYKNTSKYMEVYGNTVIGNLGAIYPNRLNPQKILVNGVLYELDSYVNLEIFTQETNAIKLGGIVRLLLGRENRVVEIKR
jgi:hypothetical protein